MSWLLLCNGLQLLDGFVMLPAARINEPTLSRTVRNNGSNSSARRISATASLFLPAAINRRA